MLLDLPFNLLNDGKCLLAQCPREVMVKSKSDDGKCCSVIYLYDFLLLCTGHVWKLPIWGCLYCYPGCFNSVCSRWRLVFQQDSSYSWNSYFYNAWVTCSILCMCRLQGRRCVLFSLGFFVCVFIYSCTLSPVSSLFVFFFCNSTIFMLGCTDF